jgi:hypothetical protein
MHASLCFMAVLAQLHKGWIWLHNHVVSNYLFYVAYTVTCAFVYIRYHVLCVGRHT